MPDHVHGIVTFDLAKGIKPTVADWKRYQKTTLKVDWQPDFFEHRLRDDTAFKEKVEYIRMNPIRKGLVSSPEEWPYVVDRMTIEGKAKVVS